MAAAEGNEINKSELEKVLTKIIEEMKKKDMLPPSIDVKNLVEKITEHLENQPNLKLNEHDLKNSNVKKLLMGVVASQILGIKNDEFTEKLKSVDREKPSEEEEKKNDLKLGASLKLLMALNLAMQNRMDLLNKNTPKPTPGLDKAAKDVIAKEIPELKNADKDKEHQQELDALEKNFSDALRSLYGGDDPRLTGEVIGPVVGQIVGNLFGFMNQTTPNPESTAFMVEAVTHNAGKPDYTGVEEIALTNELASGIYESPSLTMNHR